MSNSNRREQILQSLAQMLEALPSQAITTAKLAAEVGVSEAALYRHFPSKVKMFESLINFIEETLLSRVSLIMKEEVEALPRCEAIVTLLLTFAERNPGLCRLLIGDAFAGDGHRLQDRIVQIFDRLEMQLRHVIREAEIREGLKTDIPQNQAANLLLTYAEGKINQFVRSDFKRLPTVDWPNQWKLISASLFLRY